MGQSKILAIKIRALGDTVLMTAPLLELSRIYPQSQLHVLVSQEWAPLLEGFPRIHRIWTAPPTKNPVAKAYSTARLALELRRENFERVVNFHASPSSATLAWLTGSPKRAIHFHGHRTNNQYSTVAIPGKGTLKPIIERDMDTVRAFGSHIPAGRMPQLFPQTTEIQRAQTLLDRFGLQTPVLAIGLGASRPTKAWPIERFTALAIEWCRKEKGGVLVLASPGERNKIQQFRKIADELLAETIVDPQTRSSIRKRIASTHELNLRELMSVLKASSVFVGNDSGPKHVAVAVNTPTVTIFGPEHPYEWHPYPLDRHPYLFVENLLCRKDADPEMPPWCGLKTCIEEEHRCMTQIGVNAVLEKCQAILDRS